MFWHSLLHMRAGIRSDICSVLTPCGPKGWQAGELSGGVEEAGDEAGKEGRTSLRQNYRSSPGRCGSKKNARPWGFTCVQMHASVYTSTRIHMYNAYTCARTCLYIYINACVFVFVCDPQLENCVLLKGASSDLCVRSPQCHRISVLLAASTGAESCTQNHQPAFAGKYLCWWND